jgi:hypothetical protein
MDIPDIPPDAVAAVVPVEAAVVVGVESGIPRVKVRTSVVGIAILIVVKVPPILHNPQN